MNIVLIISYDDDDRGSGTRNQELAIFNVHLKSTSARARMAMGGARTFLIFKTCQRKNKNVLPSQVSI
jgi:hypothetical protein